MAARFARRVLVFSSGDLLQPLPARSYEISNCLSLSLSFIEPLSLCIPLLGFPLPPQQTACVSSLWCATSTPVPTAPDFTVARVSSCWSTSQSAAPHTTCLSSQVMVDSLASRGEVTTKSLGSFCNFPRTWSGSLQQT